MVRRRYGLPSLNALAAFEAAARHLSLTKAAEELNVTPGAISKQVRLLEDELGRPLFARLHRALELTPQGEALSSSVRDGFERMSGTFRQMRQATGHATVTIGSTMAFAQLWLMPRLGSFWARHQDIVIDHVISDHARGLDRPDIDMRFRYGGGAWPDEMSAKLFDDHIFAVASPGFVAAHAPATVDDVVRLPLLSVEGIDWTWTTWEEFLRAVGRPQRRLNVRRFNSYVIALQAARSGQGIALGWAQLVRPLIEAGDLVPVTDLAVKAPESYYVTWSTKRPLNPEAQIFRDWLLTQHD